MTQHWWKYTDFWAYGEVGAQEGVKQHNDDAVHDDMAMGEGDNDIEHGKEKDGNDDNYNNSEVEYNKVDDEYRVEDGKDDDEYKVEEE